MTVGELLHRIDSYELTEWAAYYKVEPFGEAREDLRAASLLALLANIYRDKKKRRRAYTPKDFLLDFWRDRPEAQSQQDIATMLQAVNAALGGRDLR